MPSPLADFIQVINVIAVIAAPVVGAMIPIYHASNVKRWDAVERRLESIERHLFRGPPAQQRGRR